jgi:hypothetical protein
VATVPTPTLPHRRVSSVAGEQQEQVPTKVSKGRVSASPVASVAELDQKENLGASLLEVKTR